MARATAWHATLPVDAVAEAAISARVSAITGVAEPAIAADDRLGWGTPFAETACGRLVAALPADELRALAMWAQRRARGYSHVREELLSRLARRSLGWSHAELVWMLRRCPAGGRGIYELMRTIQVPLAALQRLDADALRPFQDTLIRLHGVIGQSEPDGMTGDQRRLTRRVQALLDRLDPPDATTALPAHLLHDKDEFGPAARALLADPGSSVIPLVLHCASAGEQVNAGVRWSARARALLGAAPAGADALRSLLDLFCAQRVRSVTVTYYGSEYDQQAFVHDDTATLVRGLVWAAALLPGEDTSALLARVGVAAGRGLAPQGQPRCARVASSAVAALATRDDAEALAGLLLVDRSLRDRSLRTRVEAALRDAAARRGTSLGELRESAVPTCQLGSDGRLSRDLGPYRAELAITESGVALTFHRGERALASAPAALRRDHGDALAELRRLAKEAGALFTAERTRLDDLLSTDRTWSGDAWQALLDHPISGVLGRRLLWQVSDDGSTWDSGRPETGWILSGLTEQHKVASESRVRLWHPLRVPIAEVTAWRDLLVASGERQPIKQAFREAYVLTPAEERTDTYSNRFAGHILRYRQAGALLRTRGWRANHLGYWDGGYEGEAWKEYADGTWRAGYFYDLVEDADNDDEANYCSSDQARFERRTPDGWQHARLADVPVLVFSDAMRDLDLVMAVTSIAADPEWTDRGGDRFREYWERATFGELTGSAEVRRDALARLLPRTRIADRVELTDRFLRVRGRLRTYKIHLGSANILMEPNDQYLCIVTARGGGDQVYLPFDDDQRLAVILSKAFLLAADDEITDPSITHQLRL